MSKVNNYDELWGEIFDEKDASNENRLEQYEELLVNNMELMKENMELMKENTLLWKAIDAIKIEVGKV